MKTLMVDRISDTDVIICRSLNKNWSVEDGSKMDVELNWYGLEYS